ncbi:hypothetical protein BofuT4_P045560.1 [Botrytis cinerea T4]|uniref:Uncharacterized protein n=1 Tax=Botryotinia fuckeliana (strain T4) TaxID=999810 RepID=G2XYK1_BOTF4|nr:hypothetical protein BofuT4_P045560.1 [Botrytis cinerea T4]
MYTNDGGITRPIDLRIQNESMENKQTGYDQVVSPLNGYLSATPLGRLFEVIILDSLKSTE